MKKTSLIIFISLFFFQVRAEFVSIQQQLDRIQPLDFHSIDLFSQVNSSVSFNTLNRFVSKFDLINVNPSTLKEIASNNYPITVKIPIDGQWETISLVKNNRITEDIILTTQDKDGQQPFSYKFGSYYYGKINGQPNSLVSISFFENDIIGLISTVQGNYVIGKSNVKNPIENEYIVYNDQDMLVKEIFPCNTSDANKVALNHPIELPINVEAYTTKCVKIYFECDFQTYSDNGSNTTTTTNYVTGLFNLVSTLYLNDSILTSISQINIWTATDPYAAFNSTSDMLTEFSTQKSNNGFVGDLAHLLSTRGVGGGIAWLDVFCSSNYYKTGVSGSLSTTLTPLPTFSWNAEVVTHELGHNMGSPHTHACAWNGNNTRIDNCGGNYNIAYQEGTCNSFPANPVGGGTIMSYCHLIGGIGINFNLGFGSQPRILIRDNVNTAPCLTTCPTCAGALTITGNYSTALTESSTWIKTSGQTTTSSTTSVKLDADPSNGYILISPTVSTDYFIASPTTNAGVMVAQAYNGCLSGSPLRPVNENSNEQSILVYNDFVVYPNPAYSSIILSNLTLENSILDLSIYSVDGRMVQQINQLSFNQQVSIDLNQMPTGFYILKIKYNDTSKIIKFQKQ